MAALLINELPAQSHEVVKEDPVPVVSEFSVALSPNPTSGACRVSIKGASGDDATLRIFNASGAVMYELCIRLINGETDIPLDTRDLPTGMYFLQVVSGKEQRHEKLVKI
jgi:hypothetical protein